MCFFDSAFWQQLITTFVGVLLGIPAGLFLESRLGAHARDEQARQLRQAIGVALDHNVALLKQLSVELAQQPLQTVPTYSLDLALLNATSYEAYRTLSDVAAAVAVGHAAYELGHLDSKLELLRHLFPGHVHTPGSGNAVRSLQGSCLAHIPLVQQSVGDALAQVRKP